MRHLTALAVRGLTLVALGSCNGIALGQSVTLAVGPEFATGGGSVTVPINLTSSGGASAAGLQWTLSYSSDVTGVTFSAGIAAANAGKSLVCAGNTCLIYGLNTTT